jgi:hypothetical protein
MGGKAKRRTAGVDEQGRVASRAVKRVKARNRRVGKRIEGLLDRFFNQRGTT